MRKKVENPKDVIFMFGGKGVTKEQRETYDYYATDPIAVDYLLKYEKFDNKVWECACGNGNISKKLEEYGYNVKSTDLIYRGFGEKESVNFLMQTEKFDGDIITNPPYNNALEFVNKALELSKRKVAMFLKLQFIETQKRYKKLFSKNPPSTVYVFVKRIKCFKNNEPTSYVGAICYCWFVWDKEYDGEPIIRWIDNT